MERSFNVRGSKISAMEKVLLSIGESGGKTLRSISCPSLSKAITSTVAGAVVGFKRLMVL